MPRVPPADAPPDPLPDRRAGASAAEPAREPDDGQRLAALALVLVEGIGPRLRQALVERFDSPAGVLAAAPSQWREVPQVGPKLAAALGRADLKRAADELERCLRHGLRVILDSDADYPRALRSLPDPPGVLFCRGRLEPHDELAVAVVGARHATRYGLDVAARLAAGLARAGLTVVSGLARGIDAAAHRGALEAGGRTLAVLAGGLGRIYPPEHAALADQVAAAGALLTETPWDAQPQSGRFPQRNRLISGLSLGVVVVEAADRSGALITARHAAEQGREVFAVPGRIDNPMSRGCHRLLRDGARLVESIDDVLDELGPLVGALPQPDGRTLHHPAELRLNDLERQVLEAIDTQATPLDAVIAATGLPAAQVLATVCALEIRHLVRRTSPSHLIRG